MYLILRRKLSGKIQRKKWKRFTAGIKQDRTNIYTLHLEHSFPVQSASKSFIRRYFTLLLLHSSTFKSMFSDVLGFN